MPKPFILELYFLFVSISWEMLEGYNRLELLIPEKVKPHSHTQLFMYVKYFLVHIRKFGKWPHPTHKLIFQFRMKSMMMTTRIFNFLYPQQPNPNNLFFPDHSLPFSFLHLLLSYYILRCVIDTLKNALPS